MRLLLWMIGGLLGLGAIVTIVGWLLPVGHEASRSADLRASPAVVYGLVSDVAAYPSWWADITAVEMLPSESGRIRFREVMSTGPVVMEVEDAARPTRFVTRIADPAQPFGGTWTFDILPAATGSRVTITERGEIHNPLFRFMARFVFGYTSTMESCLESMRARVGG